MIGILAGAFLAHHRVIHSASLSWEFLGRTSEISAGASGISLKAVKEAKEYVV